MTPATLQALRRLLFFSVGEAAAWVAAGPERPDGVSERSWQFWERGERTIPADVIATLQRLCVWRRQALEEGESAIFHAERTAEKAGHGAAEFGGVALIWYPTVDDWLWPAGRPEIMWRPQCSVVAELAARRGARLVEFDQGAYSHWLGRRKDAEMMRAAWAAQAAE